MTILGTKDLGQDPETTLNRQLQVWQITIDGKSETILVVYDIVLLSPNDKVVKILSTENYRRFNRPEYTNGETTIPANNKFDALKLSPVGQMILGMLQVDLNNIQGFDTLGEDLAQD